MFWKTFSTQRLRNLTSSTHKTLKKNQTCSCTDGYFQSTRGRFKNFEKGERKFSEFGNPPSGSKPLEGWLLDWIYSTNYLLPPTTYLLQPNTSLPLHRFLINFQSPFSCFFMFDNRVRIFVGITVRFVPVISVG